MDLGDQTQHFQVAGAVLDMHRGKQPLNMVLYNVRKVFNIPVSTESTCLLFLDIYTETSYLLFLQGDFFTGSALKVLSVGDGKIPSKKVKVEVSYRVFNSNLPFLVGILPSPTLRTFRAEPVKKSPCKIYIFDNLIVNCFFQGAPKEGILRCSLADDNTFSDNVFLNRQLTEEVEKDFKAGRVYAVELEHLSVFDKAKHCASIISYKKV